MRCDTLGDEWTRHHTYGTCRQLSLWSCGSLEDSVSHQTILHSSRIMEACRSILYDSPIAVNDYQWMKPGDVNTTYGSADAFRSIFDELIDFLVQCSHFGSRYGQSLFASNIEFTDTPRPGCELKLNAKYRTE